MSPELVLRQRIVAVICVLILVGAISGAAAFWPERMEPPPSIEQLNATVEKGRYLATIGNCVSCHTTGNGKEYSGGVGLHTPFGTIYSTNITMDRETGIGNWSFEDFYTAMKHGVRPDGTNLYPAFPYTSYARMTAEDIASIYLYTRTIQPVRASPRPNELGFPYKLRFALRAWNKLFLDDDEFAPDSSQSAEWNRGAYLVEGPGHCGACHTPRNALGAERAGLSLAGGVIIDWVAPRKVREWAAVNLTPATTGLGKWSVEDIVSYLKQGMNGNAVVHGPMNAVVINSTRHLQDADARAIATYLKGIPAIDQKVAGGTDENLLASGEIAYTVHCGACHLPTGLGDRILGVALTGNAIVQASDPTALINVILYGPRLPPPPFVVDRTRMKPFGKRLSDRDIASLASYVRVSFGNGSGEVTAEQVRRQR